MSQTAGRTADAPESMSRMATPMAWGILSCRAPVSNVRVIGPPASTSSAMRRVTGWSSTSPASMVHWRCQSAEPRTAGCVMFGFLPGHCLPDRPQRRDRGFRRLAHDQAPTGRRLGTSAQSTHLAQSVRRTKASAAPGLVTSCRSQRRCSSGRDDDAYVTARQTAIVLWILPPQNAPHGRGLTGLDANYVFDLGGAKRARTADLLHAMKGSHSR